MDPQGLFMLTEWYFLSVPIPREVGPVSHQGLEFQRNRQQVRNMSCS